MDYYYTDTDVINTLFKLLLKFSLLYTDTDGFSTREKILNFFCAANNSSAHAARNSLRRPLHPEPNHLHSITAVIP